MAGHPQIDRGERPFDLRDRKLSLKTNELLSSQMTSHRLSFCYGLIIALLLQGLIHRYGPALFRLAPRRPSRVFTGKLAPSCSSVPNATKHQGGQPELNPQTRCDDVSPHRGIQ